LRPSTWRICSRSVVQAGQRAVAGPDGEVVLDQRSGWEVGRQRIPLAAGTGHVADGVHDVPPGVGHRPAADTGPGATDGHQRRQDLPLSIRGVRRVDPPTPGGQVLVGLGHRGCAMAGQNMDTQGRAFWDRAEVWYQCSYSKAPLRSARHAATDRDVSMITVIRQPNPGYLPGSYVGVPLPRRQGVR